MKIKFVGAGSAFNKADGQCNILITADSGKKLLIDCGTYFWQMAAEQNIAVKDIDALYVSHLHADHVGGIEEFAFISYFSKLPRPKLYCNHTLMKELWEQSLRGGLESIQGKVVTLTEYFDCVPVQNNDTFYWEGYGFTPVQTVHVMAGYTIKYSYGLLIGVPEPQGITGKTLGGKTVFITTDSQFSPHQIKDFYNRADVVFQDSETSPFKSGVHAHYDELKTLSAETKAKMWLCHYQPNPPQMKEPVASEGQAPWKLDGFAGFVTKGQEFDI